MFERVTKKAWFVRGLYGMPEDFDWETIPREVLDRENELNDRFGNAHDMIAAVKATMATLDEIGNETPLTRAYHFGKNMPDWFFTID